jgi:hypothetical protein
MEVENPIPSESIEIPNSEEIEDQPPVDPETPPSEETPEEVPEVPPETPAEAELYELPDGRKVDGATLAREWKENFAPEFTRRSQELAELKKGNLPADTPPKNPYEDPDYVPGSYQEIIEAAKQAALAELAQKEESIRAAQTAAENAVVEQLDAVKKLDPNVDENKLFLHANKYGFRDLSTAYMNMKDMNLLVKTTQKQTVENIAKRKDPVSVQPGGQVGNTPDPSAFGSAVEFMRSLSSS